MSNNVSKKSVQATNRSRRVRASITGSTERPRLSVNISNLHIIAQIINDESGLTLAYVTTVGQTKLTGTMTQKAVWVGTEIAKVAKKNKISKVVLDRGSKLYHGRIKALAEAARQEGLEF